MSARQLPTERRGPALRPPSAGAGAKAHAEADAGAEAHAEAPVVLERYRLIRRLGAGAFGTVWAAHDERLEREVAVKILPRERVVGGRFEREARTAARLSHPAVVTLYEAAVDDEGAYLVSELVRGRTLQAQLESGRLSDRGILRLGIALCDALAHAHAEGVIHRDVKPSNVLIPTHPSSASYPAKLTDFGIARVLGGDSLTRTGDVVGTAAYMAPEQAEGRTVGPEADLYALALVLYEALTGVNPVRNFATGPRARRLATHLPPLRRQRRDLPRELGAGIDLALRPRPRERGTLAELRRGLETSLDRVADRPGIVAAPWRGPRRTEQRPTEFRHRSTRPPELEFDAGAPAEPDLEDAALPAAIPRWARAAAALAVGATAAWLGSRGLLPNAVPAGLAATVAATVVVVMPRVGWIGLAAVVAALSAASGHAGGGLVLALLLPAPAVLMPGRAAAWPLPAGAVALGLIGFAGAWPALAARLGGSAWRRATVAACGFVWLAGAGQLAGADLLLRRARSVPAPAVWTASLRFAAQHVLGTILSPEVLAGALVWGLAAAVLPWLVRGWRPAIEAALVAVWTLGLAVATAAALETGGGDRAPAARVAALGALAGLSIALGPTWWAAVRRAHRRSGAPA